jgi:hypothetical protein
MTAEVITYDNTGMDAVHRCDRCGAQAFVEVALNTGGTLLFCAHHADEHEDKIMALDAVVADHRPFLTAAQEDAARKLGLTK